MHPASICFNLGMAPYSVLVTGANRGIGLGLVKEFLKNEDIQHVIATARDTSAAKELNEIKDKRLVLLPLDLTCDDSIRNLYTEFCRQRVKLVLVELLGQLLSLEKSTNWPPTV
ncbi:hypothetical protein ANCDUO_13369 [Ancylostoma duodenale]|uniref:Oxidoreductase, short chain dehydrogenase/reductase family protein n=1 Tax=Ancylostoma duodenale TaxID=51022 RepID=A0A0C2GC55_9BILA|nr:hypothetical protein ANCDUO_13369 [Ancylostoma duodenale]